ncbi:DUF4825 domain-containing protein [Mesobacillus foraminis]|uniref:Uncharacterized protein DUF4825 n=2 Tax=Mesobacillus foraminis TaxID=279826 RepID=A0A4R2BGW6_9BACI|nr:uncharacterized protein DUF4825 [Mesobacillus foraminis]
MLGVKEWRKQTPPFEDLVLFLVKKDSRDDSAEKDVYDLCLKLLIPLERTYMILLFPTIVYCYFVDYSRKGGMQVRKIIKLMFFSITVMLLLNGCNSNSANEDLFQFKNSFVGDNSAVVNITNQLHSSEHLDEIELKTKEKPYGITLNYDMEKSQQEYKDTAIYNATYILALVQNADWITFQFGNQEYKVTKENLQSWYGTDLSELTTEEELESFIQEQLEDESKVNQFFS